jgi:hypothetical membrane protein
MSPICKKEEVHMRRGLASSADSASDRLAMQGLAAGRSQTPVGSRRWDQFVKWSGIAAMVYPFLFVLVFTVAGLLRPGYSPISQAVSDLGVGSMAWLLNVPVVILGLVMIALAVGFFQATRPSTSPASRWTCATLVALPGLGYIAAGIFTEDPSTVLIHWLVGATLGLYFPVVTFVILGMTLVPHREWRWYGIYSLVVGVATVAAIVFVQQAFTPGSALFSFHVAGLAERVDLVVILAWYVVFGWGLFSYARLVQKDKQRRMDL